MKKHQLSAALVILNMELANLCVAARVQTVYVDSLPYIWTEHDPVPTDVTLYCAQNFPFIPDLARPILKKIKNLEWVEGIVPNEEIPLGSPSLQPNSEVEVLVNLGGIGTHLIQVEEASYPVIIAEATLRALERIGFSQVRLAGNVKKARLSEVVARHPDMRVTVGTSNHQEFQDLMAQTPLLLTSPGLTTLIESGAMQKRTVILPPQCLSQFFNAEGVIYHSQRPEVVVQWPETVVDRATLENIRRGGEDAALLYLYREFRRAEGDERVVEFLTDSIVRAVQAGRRYSATSDYTNAIGRQGAPQVAHKLRQMLASS